MAAKPLSYYHCVRCGAKLPHHPVVSQLCGRACALAWIAERKAR